MPRMPKQSRAFWFPKRLIRLEMQFDQVPQDRSLPTPADKLDLLGPRGGSGLSVLTVFVVICDLRDDSALDLSPDGKLA